MHDGLHDDLIVLSVIPSPHHLCEWDLCIMFKHIIVIDVVPVGMVFFRSWMHWRVMPSDMTDSWHADPSQGRGLEARGDEGGGSKGEEERVTEGGMGVAKRCI